MFICLPQCSPGECHGDLRVSPPTASAAVDPRATHQIPSPLLFPVAVARGLFEGVCTRGTLSCMSGVAAWSSAVGCVWQAAVRHPGCVFFLCCRRGTSCPPPPQRPPVRQRPVTPHPGELHAQAIRLPPETRGFPACGALPFCWRRHASPAPGCTLRDPEFGRTLQLPATPMLLRVVPPGGFNCR